MSRFGTEEQPAVVAVDVGGGGARVSAETLGGVPLAEFRADKLPAGQVATDPTGAFRALAASLTDRLDGRGVHSVAAGIAGLSTHAEDPVQLRQRLAEAFGAAHTIAVGDEVTAHLGCLGGAAGAVLAAGTGAIALGTDGGALWRRTDGWGHLLGDLGSGAWIGMEALRTAAASLDGRRTPEATPDASGDTAPAPSADAALAEAAMQQFGALPTWPEQLYPMPDRARILASFVPAVVELADDGDRAAGSILEAAAGHLARTLGGVVGGGVPARVGLIGGLFAAPPPLLREPLLAQLRRRLPELTVADPEGTPLDGGMLLARRLIQARGAELSGLIDYSLRNFAGRAGRSTTATDSGR